jgi:hypothetical protein
VTGTESETEIETETGIGTGHATETGTEARSVGEIERRAETVGRRAAQTVGERGKETVIQAKNGRENATEKEAEMSADAAENVRGAGEEASMHPVQRTAMRESGA